ncbi:MAG TPA: HlyD family efflux transporter periplasmic adaptor subunit [Steroidobacteraceae bacterium]|jgi:membrane fusion protein (multidrug efflux system)|nr:HlyD family efflux transporter periplasmic adaptor subunit [Steroidobacteraceae bacterium]
MNTPESSNSPESSKTPANSPANTPAAAPTAGPRAAASPNRARRAGLLAVGAAVVLGAVGYGAYWFFDGRYYESTDDAYVDGDVVQVTSEVPGTVLSLNVDDTQRVHAGQPLLELDPADAKIAVANAEADLARAVRQVRGLFAQSRELRAQIEQREQAERTADEDLTRRGGLLKDGAISAEELSHARDAVTTTRANVAAAQQQLDQTVAQIDGTTIADHPQVLAAAAAVRNAELALHRTELISPVTGEIAKRSVEVGQRVAAGTPLLAVVPLDDVWIDANFKEVQLKRMRAGQPVTVSTDLYGHSVTYHGHVVGIAAGSGSAFALLPAQNASGNWIKIVQRVPVRILLDPAELEAHPLRVGLSTSVRVDLHDTSGPLMSTAVRNVALPKERSAGDDPAVTARIDAIIAENAGPKANEPAHLSRNARHGNTRNRDEDASARELDQARADATRADATRGDAPADAQSDIEGGGDLDVRRHGAGALAAESP